MRRNAVDGLFTELLKWGDDVEEIGLEEVMKIKSYHDELCKGKRKGLRSIRLTRGRSQ